jgi:hypothetical protein
VNEASTQFERLLARLDTTVWLLGRDEPVDLPTMEALLAEVVAIAPTVAPAAQNKLLRSAQKLQIEAEAAHRRLGDRIGRLGAGRRALHGYARPAAGDLRGRLLRRA